MTSSPVPPQPHIPAWKKLGLKLKYAKDDPTPAVEPSVINNGKKRKHIEESTNGYNAPAKSLDATNTLKKNKKSHSNSTKDSTTQSSDSKSESAANSKPESSSEVKSNSSPPPPTSTLTKRKSVSFTPETKAEDGQSTKDLYAHWIAAQKAEDPSFKPPYTLTALQPITAPPSSSAHSTSQSSKKAKKPKPKTKLKSQTSDQQSNDATHPGLTYLTTFTTSPQTWKFSKNHQIYLLKHLFDLSKIPPSHDKAIEAYLSGLKGDSARKRIREVALKVREEEEMWFSELLAVGSGDGGEKERKRRREEYEAAWSREKERLEDNERKREVAETMGMFKGEAVTEWEYRVYKRRRAERLIWMVGEKAEAEADVDGIHKADGLLKVNEGAGADGPAKVNGAVGSDGQTNGNLTKAGKRKRVRKRRTTEVPDDESSSSSSESSSDSSSDEGGATVKGKRLTAKVAESKMDTVSEGSTSSESDSDSSSGSSSSSDSEDSD